LIVDKSMVFDEDKWDDPRAFFSVKTS